MKPEYTILAMLFIHWVSDFVLQTHKMATNKSTSVKWLSAHVGVYVLAWFFAGFLIFPVHLVAAFVGITFICHWVTDYFTSKWTSRLWREGKIHDFFVVIGFDQFLHFFQLIITYTLLTQSNIWKVL